MEPAPARPTLVGPGWPRGYGSLTAVAASVPGWEAVANALDQRREEALRFFALVAKVDRALGAGDLAGARAAAKAGAGLGGWFDALAEAVTAPDGSRLVRTPAAKPDPGTTTPDPTAATVSRAGWYPRFLGGVANAPTPTSGRAARS